MFSKMQIWRVLVSPQNETSCLARNATENTFVLLQMPRVTFLLLPFSLCFKANFLRRK